MAMGVDHVSDKRHAVGTLAQHLVENMPTLEAVQRQYIHQVLAATGNNKRCAADILGITHRTLYRWIEAPANS